MSTNQNQPQAGALSTGALVGFRLFQALGWRVGAGVLLVAGCPLASAGGLLLSYVSKCAEITRPGRAGAYQFCTDYSAEHWIGALLALAAVLFVVAAVGLWRRGGAVRDVELLAERVERPAQRASSASTAVIDGQVTTR